METAARANLPGLHDHAVQVAISPIASPAVQHAAYRLRIALSTAPYLLLSWKPSILSDCSCFETSLHVTWRHRIYAFKLDAHCVAPTVTERQR